MGRRALPDPIPVSHDRMPDPDFPDTVSLLQFPNATAKPFRKLTLPCIQIRQNLLFIVCRKPSIVDQRPLYRHFLLPEFLHLIQDPLMGYLMIKSVPAAPAKIRKHLRITSVLSEHGLPALIP